MVTVKLVRIEIKNVVHGKQRVNLPQQCNIHSSSPCSLVAMLRHLAAWVCSAGAWGPEPHSVSLSTASLSVWCRMERKPSPRFTKPAFVFDSHFDSHSPNYASPTCHFNTCCLRSYQSMALCLYSNNNYEHKPYLHPQHTTHHVLAVQLYPK